jgi:hypothetical protein
MSRDCTLARQRARVGALGLRVHEQLTHRDVDTIGRASEWSAPGDQPAAHVRRRTPRLRRPGGE